jgi:hypothetical protein
MQNLDSIHNVELSQGEVSTILYYIESYFQGSDDNPEADADLMSVCRKLETPTARRNPGLGDCFRL